MTLSNEVVSAVTGLLASRGKERAAGERFEQFVSRGLHLAPRHTRAFLRLLEDGNSIEDAMLIAGIDMEVTRVSRLTAFARSVGAAIGTVVAKLRTSAGLLIPRSSR